MEEYIKHIKDEVESNKQGYTVAICGERVGGWLFENIDHAFYNNKAKGRSLPCPKCVEKVTEVLNQK